MKSPIYGFLSVLPLSLLGQGTIDAPVIRETGPDHAVLTWNTLGYPGIGPDYYDFTK